MPLVMPWPLGRRAGMTARWTGITIERSFRKIWRSLPFRNVAVSARALAFCGASFRMAIEFDCPNCKQLVKTPDAAAGKKGRCPNCQSVVQIPTASTSTAAPRKVPISEAETRDLSTEVDGPFEFPCPSCGNTMRATTATVGKKGRCASCKNVVVIPSPPAAQTSAPTPSTPARAEIDEDSLIARFGEEEEETPKLHNPRFGPSPTPMAPQPPPGANPWAAWGQQGAKPATPLPNPFLSALDDASKKNPEQKLNPYATTAMIKAAEKGVEYSWDDDLNNRVGLAYERPQSESPFGETFKEVLFDSDQAFRRMLVDREVGKSVSYLSYGAATVGLIIGGLYASVFLVVLGIGVATGKLDEGNSVPIVATLLGAACGALIGGIGIMVVWSLITVTLFSVVHHLVLLVTGRLQRGFGTTFKVNAYIMGTCIPMSFIPCVGIAMGIITPILLVVGIRRAHNISLGRAIGVVVLPYVIFMGLYVMLVLAVSASLPAPPQGFPGR